MLGFFMVFLGFHFNSNGKSRGAPIIFLIFLHKSLRFSRRFPVIHSFLVQNTPFFQGGERNTYSVEEEEEEEEEEKEEKEEEEDEASLAAGAYLPPRTTHNLFRNRLR